MRLSCKQQSKYTGTRYPSKPNFPSNRTGCYLGRCDNNKKRNCLSPGFNKPIDRLLPIKHSQTSHPVRLAELNISTSLEIVCA